MEINSIITGWIPAIIMIAGIFIAVGRFKQALIELRKDVDKKLDIKNCDICRVSQIKVMDQLDRRLDRIEKKIDDMID